MTDVPLAFGGQILDMLPVLQSLLLSGEGIVKFLRVKGRFSCIKSVQTLSSAEIRTETMVFFMQNFNTTRNNFLCFGFQKLLGVTLLGNIVVFFDKYWDFPLSQWLFQDRSAIRAFLAWHEQIQCFNPFIPETVNVQLQLLVVEQSILVLFMTLYNHSKTYVT